jgi:glutamyl-tRNA synthetase
MESYNMSVKVRTRFAPSPTGYLHVGGLRTALFNYLFARRHSGKFILRIEDTDRNRYVEGAVEKLIDSLNQVGLSYDEGPGVGGEFGPYVQSERLDIYRDFTQKLLDSGNAYYCFCTPERLEKMREAQVARGETPKYDGACRNLTQMEVAEKISGGIPHVVRLKMPSGGETVVEDLIRGTVVFQNELIDDQVLLKSDGYPTYHLANVVDDHLMGVTHVIRGEEWLLSVPKHIQLYRALGWEPPQMAHLSLLLNSDRSKLSKRQGDVAVEDYLKKGYLPEALINFVALLGWSPGDDREFFSLDELQKEFSLERVNKAGAVFDLTKLNWMNGNYIRRFPEDDLVNFLLPYLKKAGADISDKEKTRKIILAVYKKIEKGIDVYEAAEIFHKDTLKITEAGALEVLKQDSARRVLEIFLEKTQSLEVLDMNTFRQAMKEVQNESGLKGSELWQPVRAALTGMLAGPELPVVIEVFGKDKVRNFIRQVLDKYM